MMSFVLEMKNELIRIDVDEMNVKVEFSVLIWMNGVFSFLN